MSDSVADADLRGATARPLSPETLRGLSARSNWPGTVQAFWHLVLMALAAAWVWASGPSLASWMIWPAMLALGIVQAASFAPLHETMHQTAFASRRANAVVGWICGCFSLYNWHFYQSYHIAHHRFTRDPERDPELLSPDPDTGTAYIWRVLTVPYWMMRFRIIRDCFRGDLSGYPYITERAAPKVIASVRAMTLLMLALVLASGFLLGWWVPLCFWIIPQLLGQPVLRLYLLTEHTRCSMDRNGLTNTRTMLTVGLVRLLMWNMPYHAEHHLYPSIPFHRLPDAHAEIRSKLVHLHPGYGNWHRQFIGYLWKKGRA